MKLLISAKADVNARNNHSIFPLIAAARNGHWMIVRTLLKEGANPTAMTKNGRNVLSAAAKNGHLDVIEVIYEHLVTVCSRHELDDFMNVKGVKDGWTALHFACCKGHDDVVQYLVETMKVDVMQRDHKNRTAFDLRNGDYRSGVHDVGRYREEEWNTVAASTKLNMLIVD